MTAIYKMTKDEWKTKFYSRNSFSACDYCHNDYKKQTTPAIQIGE